MDVVTTNANSATSKNDVNQVKPNAKQDVCATSCTLNNILIQWAFFKLWICDVKSMLPSPTQENAILFRNIIVERIIIFGTVTRVKVLPTKTLLELDDGTGNISCVYRHNAIFDQTTNEIMNELSYYTSKLSSNPKGTDQKHEDEMAKHVKEEDKISVSTNNVFDWLTKEVHRYQMKMKQSFDIGETICCKGRINHFYGHREIFIFNFHRIDNLSIESQHILEKVYLYENVYNKL